jgi:hypothetical protein
MTLVPRKSKDSTRCGLRLGPAKLWPSAAKARDKYGKQKKARAFAAGPKRSGWTKPPGKPAVTAGMRSPSTAVPARWSPRRRRHPQDRPRNRCKKPCSESGQAVEHRPDLHPVESRKKQCR